MQVIEGTAVGLGDNIGANAIIAPKYSLGTLPPETGKYLFPARRGSKDRTVRPGDILVAGERFGFGSVREQVVLALKQAGVGAVIARSFAPPLFRNAVNLGLPVFVSAKAVAAIETGDELQIELERWAITDVRSGETYPADPLPEFVRNIVHRGGVAAYMKEMAGRSGGAAGGEHTGEES